MLTENEFEIVNDAFGKLFNDPHWDPVAVFQMEKVCIEIKKVIPEGHSYVEFSDRTMVEGLSMKDSFLVTHINFDGIGRGRLNHNRSTFFEGALGVTANYTMLFFCQRRLIQAMCAARHFRISDEFLLIGCQNLRIFMRFRGQWLSLANRFLLRSCCVAI